MKAPRIAIGGYVEDQWVRADDFTQMLDTCTGELGITHIDTAPACADAEDVIGGWLRAKPSGFRHGLFLASKVLHEYGRGNVARPYSREHILTACDDSLRKLGVETLDLYYLHGPHGKENDWTEIMGAFDSIVRAGKACAIGLSNVYSPSELERVVKLCERNGFAKPEYLQNECHLIYQPHWTELFEAARALALNVVAFSPLAWGTLTGKYRYTEKHADLPAGSRWAICKWRFPPPYWNKAVFAGIDRLEATAEALDHTPASLALAWALFHPGISCAIIGPRRPAHLDAIRRALSKPIDERTWNSLNTVFEDCLPNFLLNPSKK